MRRVLVAALIAAPLAGLTAGPASAWCDPKYEPFCTNDCQAQPPDLKDPLEYFSRMCPE